MINIKEYQEKWRAYGDEMPLGMDDPMIRVNLSVHRLEKAIKERERLNNIVSFSCQHRIDSW